MPRPRLTKIDDRFEARRLTAGALTLWALSAGGRWRRAGGSGPGADSAALALVAFARRCRRVDPGRVGRLLGLLQKARDASWHGWHKARGWLGLPASVPRSAGAGGDGGGGGRMHGVAVGPLPPPAQWQPGSFLEERLSWQCGDFRKCPSWLQGSTGERARVAIRPGVAGLCWLHGRPGPVRPASVPAGSWVQAAQQPPRRGLAAVLQPSPGHREERATGVCTHTVTAAVHQGGCGHADALRPIPCTLSLSSSGLGGPRPPGKPLSFGVWFVRRALTARAAQLPRQAGPRAWGLLYQPVPVPVALGCRPKSPAIP